MCGINGFIQFKKKYDKNRLNKIVHDMNESIIHRGPDHEGVYTDEICSLGMRRLSIIDLQGGAQPIWNESHDKLVIFNGELYNYRILKQMLKQEGHVFSTDSDTEVVLHGIESYGVKFLEKMEGMFAFAVYDTLKKKWILARDRIGEKPLYYYHCSDCFIFASELKSILSIGIVPKEIDKEALSRYFQLTYIPAPKSIIKNVYKLMPATVMILDQEGNEYTETYWNLDANYEDNQYDDYDKCKKLLREKLFKSVGQRMNSDVPIGAFLSGGFDSAIIVGIMSQLSNKPIDTFTIGFKEKDYDESQLAKIIAEKNKTNHHILTLERNEIISDIDRILGNMDEPFADSSLIATYAVARMAKQHVLVALTGDAGDELFAGYNKYLISYYGNLYEHIPRIIRKGLIEPVVRILPSRSFTVQKVKKVVDSSGTDIYQKRKQLMCMGFKESEINKLMLDGFVDSMEFIEREYRVLRDRDEQIRAQYVDLKIVLEGDMLAKVDRASMLASLETRVPMLDSEVVRLAFRMPTRFKINRTARKIILKDAFRDMIPEELFHAPKHGFNVPIKNWMGAALKKYIYQYASPDFIQQQGLFSWQYINDMINMYMEHREKCYSELWTFFVFQYWYEHYMIET